MNGNSKSRQEFGSHQRGFLELPTEFQLHLADETCWFPAVLVL